MVVTLGHRIVGDVASATAGDQNFGSDFLRAVEKQNVSAPAGAWMAAKRPAAPAPATTTSAWLPDMVKRDAGSEEPTRLASDRWRGALVCGDKVDGSRNDLQLTGEDEINAPSGAILGIPSFQVPLAESRSIGHAQGQNGGSQEGH